ncbi:hypothetical protein ETB97_006178 [Aspergillus alliaceus]|uniref:Uncharacterized protein n=1 Tax=Petromyces alliaceus TaxID=209559 RepID=A0A8H5ZVP3_PETAA|nr:hypothetical protein ETB97_006178 [Aspergillus burnettii]
MLSFFYSTKAAKKELYPISEALSIQDVLDVLHTHSMLSQVFWPLSVTEGLEKKTTTPQRTKFTVSSLDTNDKATLTSQADAVTCTEETILGLRFTVTYRIIDSRYNPEQKIIHDIFQTESTSSLINSTTLPLETRLYLEEERSLTAPKPLSSLMKMKDGPIVKTRNLLFFLEEMSRNGADMASTIASLKDSVTVARERRQEKTKED